MNATKTLPTFVNYKNGDETTRLTFERAYPAEQDPIGGYEHHRIYDPWTPDIAHRERRIALQLLRGDEWHRTAGHIRSSAMERMSCGTCALLGYEPRGGWSDEYNVKQDGPNYAGWKRVYVQAQRPIPAKWRDAFATFTDNEAYENALGRDLVTFGHPGFAA